MASPRPMNVAAAEGDVAKLKLLRDEGHCWDAHTTYEAARHGHLHMLTLLLSEKCPCDFRACVEATLAPNVETLRKATPDETGLDVLRREAPESKPHVDCFVYLCEHEPEPRKADQQTAYILERVRAGKL